MPTTTPSHDKRMAEMSFARVYPLYVTKITNKGRTIEELDEVITWLTGFDFDKIQEMLDRQVSFKEFFEEANLNPNAKFIKGLICGYHVEDIENPLTQKVRYLDKMVDELAKGKPMEKILRKW